MMDNVTMKYLTWNNITAACISLVKQFSDMRCKFDTIVSIGRGGMVPARLLSECLDKDCIKDVRIINCHSYVDSEKKQGEMIVNSDEFNFKSLENKNVLLVDDVYTTGNTVRATKKTFLDRVPNINIMTSVLYMNLDVIEVEKNEMPKELLINTIDNPNELLKYIKKINDLDAYAFYYSAKIDWLVFPWENWYGTMY